MPRRLKLQWGNRVNYELLAPAGGEQSAYVALNSGANAVYLGLSQFSARAGAENFDMSALKRVSTYAHLLSAKVYVALNTLVKESETQAFFHTAVEAWNAGADAILLQDMFLGKMLKRAYPQMNLHLSTQAGCCNEYGARLAKEYGFSRVVVARETPIEEIKKISAVIQTEAFVQGALCSAFSGQCYFSSFAGNNSGNRGRCKQPCRKLYSIDRKGYEEKKYALSLSDLSVGERVKELLSAGVFSLKIEGRMRRAEYVSAAVGYYQTLLDGGDERAALSALMRTYNRGDYTKGLAFGQDNGLLSRDAQGHIGEEVGTLSLRGGKFFCKSNFRASEADGFKILRKGIEVGGAVFTRNEGEGFYLRSTARLAAGDSVRVTTDNALNARLLDKKIKRKITLSLTFLSGMPACVEGEGIRVEGEVLPSATNAPIGVQTLRDNFLKTDTLPFEVCFHEIKTDGVFLAKSQLNALRREFYAQLTEGLAPQREPILEQAFALPRVSPEKGKLTACITPSFEGLSADILILKPRDYATISREEIQAGKGKKYLYLPPFFSSRDEELVKDKIPLFDGLYGEGYYSLALAKKYQKSLFAGVGFHVLNGYSLQGLLEEGVEYFTLSKELTEGEQRALSARGAFALTGGGIKLMDLIYCPFQKTCKSCDRRDCYALTDEGEREFSLRRYRLSGEGCRFEVYNCASLASYNGQSSALVDCSLEKNQKIIDGAFSPEQLKKAQNRVTVGHGNRSLL